MTEALDLVQRSGIAGTPATNIDRAVGAWTRARAAGDRLVDGPADAGDILAFDRPFGSSGLSSLASWEASSRSWRHRSPPRPTASRASGPG